ncbi:MAG: aminotransferase class III-fold pyridoxal phosphate-dependent enzyme, partial [Planctomycetota bacterium]
SPDPNLILRIPTELFPPKEKSKRATSESRRRRIAGNLSLGYQDPIKMVRGWKHHLYDESGHKYLDAYNNVPHVGHCHPAVVEAVQRQMSLLSTNTRYLHDAIAELGDRIVATLPDELEVCYFLSSASEANELALRLARAHTGRKDVIVLEGAYHGHTTSLIDISPYKHDGPGGEGAPNWVHVAELADLYRGQYHDATTAGGLFAESVARICSDYSGRISAFIAESCPSVGGQIVFPPGYLSSVYEILRREGALCIADEVQTGYGRLGHSFYGFEEQEVSPDIVVLGKPIGNGYPLAAVIARRDIAESFDNGMEFFATFGGSTVSCAAGLAVLDVLANEALQENAHQTGEQLLDGFRKLQADYPIIGDVRGSGFFLGLELVRDSKSLEPAATEASFVVNRMREKGVLIGTDGPLNNVLKVRPPMTFDAQSAEQLLDALRRSLEELPR